MHGQLGIVARAFVAHKGVLAIEFVPGEMDAGLDQRLQNKGAAFVRDVRVLSTPDHEHFAAQIAETIEGIIAPALAEAAGVNVGGVKTSGFMAARKARWPPIQKLMVPSLPN